MDLQEFKPTFLKWLSQKQKHNFFKDGTVAETVRYVGKLLILQVRFDLALLHNTFPQHKKKFCNNRTKSYRNCMLYLSYAMPKFIDLRWFKRKICFILFC